MLYFFIGMFWVLSGYLGVRYWWTKDFGSFKRLEIVGVTPAAVVLGPIMWIAGYFIHGPDIRKKNGGKIWGK